MSEQQIKEILEIDENLDKMIKGLIKLFRTAAKDCEHVTKVHEVHTFNVCGHYEHFGHVCRLASCPLRNK